MPKGSKVLMADDDAMLLDMYKERLGLAGYVVEALSNGEALLAKLKDFRPDIILLDIMMPKMDGYETLAAIKSDATTKDIPVVMLSALMRDFNREKAMEGGADDYLIKSEAMPSDVITKIEQVLVKYGKGGDAGPPPETDSTPAPAPATPTPPATEPAKPAEPEAHIETQPVSPPPAPTPTTPPVPEVKTINKPVEPAKPAKKSSLWIWIVIILILVAGGLVFFFLKK